MSAGPLPEVKQVLVIRKDLNMRKGKMVAQGAHAAMAALLTDATRDESSSTVTMRLDPAAFAWLTGRFKKICVSVPGEAELLALYEEARARGLRCALIRDSGLTEFGGVPTYTTLALGPASPQELDPLTGALPLL